MMENSVLLGPWSQELMGLDGPAFSLGDQLGRYVGESPLPASRPALETLRARRLGKRGLFGGTAETNVNIAIAAGFTSVVLGTALVIYALTRANIDYTAISGITQAVKTMYQGEAYPSGSIDATIISQKKYGNQRINTTANTILNNYGGTMSWSGAGTNVLTVTDSNLPASACVDFLKSIPALGWDTVQVGSGSVISSFPITQSTASGACTGSTNTITLTTSTT
jgi:hypothetical protein